jgi:hypothetical protein
VQRAMRPRQSDATSEDRAIANAGLRNVKLRYCSARRGLRVVRLSVGCAAVARVGAENPIHVV